MSILNIRTLTLIFLLGLGTMATAWSVPGIGSQQLSLEAGGAFPTSVNNFSNDAGAGPAVGAQYLYGLDEYFGVGLQADYYAFAGKDNALTSPEGGQLAAHYKDSAATLEIMGRYNVMPEARFVPYLHSGIGLAYFHQSADATPVTGYSWSDNTTEQRNITNSTMGVAFSFGVGVETNITEHLVLGLEAAWQIFGVSKATYGTATIDAPTALLRLGWRFGHEPLQAEP